MPRFVLHRHFPFGSEPQGCGYANLKRKHSHFDLMLEQSRRLKTWQINPPESYLERIIRARLLPDHRRIYLDYEGKISRGRGIIKIVDKGDYDVIKWTKKTMLIRFKGKRIKGKYLFLMISRDKPENWLILKAYNLV